MISSLTFTRFTNLLLVASCLCFFSVGTASAVGSNDASSVMEKAIRTYLEANKLNRGWDQAQSRLVAVETSSVGVAPGNLTYFAKRQAAFERALIAARTTTVQFLGAKIKSSITAKTELTEVVGDPELAKALTGAAVNVAFKIETELEKMSEVAAQAALVGFSPIQTFEIIVGDEAVVAVVTSCSANYANWAHGKGQGAPGQTLSKWFESLTDEELSRTFATRYILDETGKYRLVAVGQASVAGPGLLADAACETAKKDSGQQLSHAYATTVACKSLSQSLTQTKTVSDLPSEFKNIKNFKDLVTANAQSDNHKPDEIGSRTINDPSSGKICIAAYALGLDTVANAPLPSSSQPQGGCPPIPENMAKFIRAVQTSGTGRNEAAAVAQALIEAINREGVHVAGDSRLEKSYKEAISSVNDQVSQVVEATVDQGSTTRTFSTGFIHSYEVIERGPNANGGFDVRICANIVRFDPKDPRFGLPPTIVVLSSSIAPGSIKVAGIQVDAAPFTQFVERTLERELLASRKYQVIDQAYDARLQQLRNQFVQRAQQGRVDELELMKLGKELTADFALVVQVDQVEFTGEAGPLPQHVEAKDMALANLQGRLINVATNEVVWQQTANARLMGRDILLARAGKNINDPAETTMSPAELACSRACASLVESLKAFLGPVVKAQPIQDGPIQIVRIAGKEVTLDASNPKVKIGARFQIETPVTIQLSGRSIIDRDKVAVIEVISLKNGLAKAKVIEGDIDLIQVGVSEVAPATPE